MRRIGAILSMWGLLCAALAGCALSENNQVKPPKQPEDYRAPPETDPRYSRAIEYPKDTMEQDPLLKKAKDKATPGPMRPGVGSPNRGF